MTTQTLTLAAWLLERFDEDEAQARLVGAPVTWTMEQGSGPNRVVAPIHIFDPARVLAEVESKRAIVALHACDDVPVRMLRGEVWPCTECGSVDDAPVDWPCDTLRLLALPYSGHETFDPAWRV